MDDFSKQLSGVLGRVKQFFEPQKIVSPLPADASPGGVNSEVDPDVNRIRQMNYAESQATQPNSPASQPSQKISNPINPASMKKPASGQTGKPTSGQPKQMGADAAWKLVKNRVPDVKITQAQFNKYYDKYGDKLVEHIPQQKPVDPQSAQTNYAASQAGQTAQPTTGVSQVDTPPKSVKGVSQDFIDYANSTILPLTRKAGIPDAVAIGQAGSESGYGSKAPNYNYWGLMSFKGGKRHLASFDNINDAVQYYADTVKNIVKSNTGKSLDEISSDPQEVLKALQGKTRYEGDNPNPMQYVYDVTNNAVWQEYGGGQAMAQNPEGWSQ